MNRVSLLLVVIVGLVVVDNCRAQTFCQRLRSAWFGNPVYVRDREATDRINDLAIRLERIGTIIELRDRDRDRDRDLEPFILQGVQSILQNQGQLLSAIERGESVERIRPTLEAIRSGVERLEGRRPRPIYDPYGDCGPGGCGPAWSRPTPYAPYPPMRGLDDGGGPGLRYAPLDYSTTYPRRR
jgi:hypothetical protein